MKYAHCMCGRAYETYTDEELIFKYQANKPIKIPERKLNYNLAPTQVSPIVFVRDGERAIDLLRWGLVPAWAKTVKDADKYSLINAKGEEIDQKRSYSAAFKNRRCIIPLSGFYEWLRPEDGPKRPFAIHLKDDPILSAAGVWEHWVNKETGEIVNSFSLITTEANSFMSKIHHRMPVILDRKDEEFWLDPNNKDIVQLKSLLVPCPSEWLEAHEVSTLVNSARNNNPEVLNPISLSSS